MRNRPTHVINDPDFGELTYSSGHWSGVIDVNSPPVSTAHLLFPTEERGPSPAQRDAILQLKKRHNELWPEIATSLVRCHPEIKTVVQLLERIVPRIEVDLLNPDDTIGIFYSVQGDPKFLGV